MASFTTWSLRRLKPSKTLRSRRNECPSFLEVRIASLDCHRRAIARLRPWPIGGSEHAMEVIVVGGAIAGLTMALSLHQAGISVRVYEAVRDLVPLGVGINLQPIAVRELTELGLGDELARSGTAIQEWSLFNKFGQLIWNEKRGLSAGYKWPQYAIHRGHLQSMLLRAVRERIGEEHFRSGLRFTGFEQDRDRIVANFSVIRSGTLVVDEADVLVGADGIHSAVRRQHYPTEGKPQFAQQVLWRAAVDAEPFLGGRTMVTARHLPPRVLVYPIAPRREA